jgi:hypothetical protein
MNQPTLSQARSRFTSSSIRWGFMWALWCAVLWGAWYVPGSAVWFEKPYVDMSYDTNAQFLLAAAVLTTFNAITVLFFLFVWNGVLGKLGDYVRTIRQMRYISKWFFIGAIFGGPMAIFGSYLAIGYIGGAFAAIFSADVSNHRRHPGQALVSGEDYPARGGGDLHYPGRWCDGLRTWNHR